MIGKITAPRGERVEPLVYYLYGPGRHNEHTDPHIVAGWRYPAELEPTLRPDGGRDFRMLLGLLKQPHAALGRRGYARPVWHCSVRAAPGDRMLSDEEWALIAHDVMDRTGLSRYGEDDDGVRWVAVRHADDHINISWRCWPGRTEPGRACTMTGTGFGTPAWPPNSGTGCGPPPRPTGPRRSPRPGARRRKQPIAAGPSRPA